MRPNFGKDFWFGFALGAVCPIVGLLLLSIAYGINYHADWLYFIERFQYAKVLQASLIKLSLIFNLIPFYIFNKKNKVQRLNGVIFATLIYAFILIINYMV